MHNDDLFRFVAIGNVVISTLTIVSNTFFIPIFMSKIENETTETQTLVKQFQSLIIRNQERTNEIWTNLRDVNAPRFRKKLSYYRSMRSIWQEYSGCYSLACPHGLPGPPGPSGLDGFPGDAGKQGKPGLDGYDIQLGPEPDLPCVLCPTGPPGQRGLQGERGRKGEPGPKGTAGKHGIPGMEGHAGRMGNEGVGGKQGERGPQGPAGDSVIAGSGIKGAKGPKGLMGPKGQMGMPGKSSKLPGKSGNPGNPGRIGLYGNPGHRGDDGSWGPPGEPGEPAEYCPSDCGISKIYNAPLESKQEKASSDKYSNRQVFVSDIWPEAWI